MTAFAIGYRDRQSPSGVWYLSRAASPGNLMRTSCPWHARTWQTVAELELWYLELDPKVRDEIKGGELLAIPMTLAVGAPVKSLFLKPRLAEVGS